MVSLKFFSKEWGEAAREAVNAGPSEEVRGQKLEKFWDWIDKAKEGLNCQWGLAVSSSGEGLDGGDCLLLHLEDGICTRAEVTDLAHARCTATFILAGDLESWKEIMSGYDMGKTIMYRKLLLAHGEVLEFFKSAYYWTESLACIQRIPTRF